MSALLDDGRPVDWIAEYEPWTISPAIRRSAVLSHPGPDTLPEELPTGHPYRVQAERIERRSIEGGEMGGLDAIVARAIADRRARADALVGEISVERLEGSTPLDTVRIIWGGRDKVCQSSSGVVSQEIATDWFRRREIVAALEIAERQARDDGRDRDAHRAYQAVERMRGCGIARGQRRCAACGHESQVQRYRCDIWQLCPYCARIHSRRRSADLRRVIEAHSDGVPGCRWRMVTLTTRTDDDYGAAVDVLSAHVGELWRDVLRWRWVQVDEPTRTDAQGRLWYRRRRVLVGRDGTYWARVSCERRSGAFRSIEFGSRTGNAHVHLLAYSPWVPQPVIASEWERLTGAYIVDVRQVTQSGRGDGHVSIGGAVSEVTKYIAKTWSGGPERAVEFWEAVRGHHVTQIYGALRGRAKSTAALIYECPDCGGTHYVWVTIPYAAACDAHTRGPPDADAVSALS